VVAYYQPEVELSSGRVVAAESLADAAAVAGAAPGLGRAGWVVPISVNVGPDSVTDSALA
jgi:hypothetical protein